MKTIMALAALLMIACATKNTTTNPQELPRQFSQYSEAVKDTFHIDVRLPTEYADNPTKRYPLIVLLDGIFFSPMMASVCDQYEVTGLLKPAILVSIGYKSFAAMDSLRIRDYLYPAALPSDEMRAPGGGLNFSSYVEHELLPRIDKNFRTEKDNRALLGHSFGGYFVLLSLYNQLQTGSHTFKTFVSASPSLWYHDFYLNQLPPLLKNNKDELNVFVSVGGLEDSTWSVKPVTDFAAAVKQQNAQGLQFKSTVYSDLEHMDVAMQSFTKGLQTSLNDKTASEGQ